MEDTSGTEWGGLALISITVAVLVAILLGPRLEIELSIGAPRSLYVLFYGLYYLMPYILLAATGNLPPGYEARIGWLFLLGLFGFWTGHRLTWGRARKESVPGPALRRRDALAFLGLGACGVGLVGYFYVSRILDGAFFSHWNFYEHSAFVEEGLRDVFASSWQIPTLLFFSFAAQIMNERSRRPALWLCWGYGIALMLVILLSSQTRPAVTILVLLVALGSGHGMARLGGKKVIVLGAAALACVLFVQGVRMRQEEFGEAENQFGYGATHSWSAAVTGVSHGGGVIYDQVAARLSGSIEFLAILMKASDSAGYLYGRDFGTWISAIVPHLLWPGKPAVVNPATSVQILYGIPIFDATLGPAVEFFIEGGGPGVFLGFLGFGALMGFVARKMLYAKTGLAWVVFLFMVGSVLNLEEELAVGFVGTLRSAMIAAVLFQVVKIVVDTIVRRHPYLAPGSGERKSVTLAKGSGTALEGRPT